VYDTTRWLILHGRRAAVARLELQPADRVLEIGCGTGLNFRYLLAYLRPGMGQLTGVDFSAPMLRRAARRVARAGWSNVELIEADATTLDLGRCFNAVFFGYSLTMIPDSLAALARAGAHLGTGGRIVVLDFGRFDRWGPLAPALRTWLRWNHVDTARPYADQMRQLFAAVTVQSWLGGYSFLAVGRNGT
jgi:ubiquinone/menaquinone biosynthesis C-methylase UbiE